MIWRKSVTEGGDCECEGLRQERSVHPRGRLGVMSGGRSRSWRTPWASERTMALTHWRVLSRGVSSFNLDFLLLLRLQCSEHTEERKVGGGRPIRRLFRIIKSGVDGKYWEPDLFWNSKFFKF